MNEGQNGTGGLNANGNAGGFFVPGNSMTPTGLSALPNGSDSVVYVGDNGKQRKSKKWLIGAILVVVLLIAAAIFVVVKHTDIVDKIVHGGKMSNEELVEKIDQVNLDLRNLTNMYNNMIGSGSENVGNGFLMNRDSFDDNYTEYEEMEAELLELPLYESTRLDDAKKQEYEKVYNEMWDRYKTAKDGMILARKFNEVFFWPMASYSSGEGGYSQDSNVRSELIANDNGEVSEVAKEFDELYRLATSGSDVEMVNTFLDTHKDILVKYNKCFTRIDSPDVFYAEVNTFVGGIDK